MLVTAIIDPSSHFAQHLQARFPGNGQAHMPDFSDKMTVQQLSDLVAFLQTQYQKRQPNPFVPLLSLGIPAAK
jgi:hypothetical protein